VNVVEHLLGSLAYGAASALVPLLNAEAFAVISGARTAPLTAVALVLALALGQTAGKLAMFEAARRGSARFVRRFAARGGSRTARWAARIDIALATRRTGLPLVLTASSLGVPPLAAVSIAAGASSQRRWEFAAACLTGRIARFAVLVLPASWAFA
jgi:membrane protein YqaA with SNARE-associated domain